MPKISGSVIAIAVAGLTRVVAASGATYAVTTSAVTISDPTTPTRMATVDTTGRLATADPVSTVNSAGYLLNYQTNSWNYLTSPTTATLAITRVLLSNPGRNGTNEEQLALYKVGVTSTGACGTSATLLAYYDLSAGQVTIDDLSAPLVVKPTGGAKYCLALYVVATDADQGYYVTYGLAAYAPKGTYSGIGTGSASAVAPADSLGAVPGAKP